MQEGEISPVLAGGSRNPRWGREVVGEVALWEEGVVREERVTREAASGRRSLRGEGRGGGGRREEEIAREDLVTGETTCGKRGSSERRGSRER
ncbi:hypothetical protein GUJ93_ZPchr0007g5511 [Zizania palustris]|uniref:Uncharacterized protein n=1 Tax=Zizania palustris TaxID=103762 RepID=A0A8J5T130_ZIZPA|nr:hypothetical protein GUJ93_ZPchr0007g5511 [Zizania palustris]